jgi:hypothetical protein
VLIWPTSRALVPMIRVWKLPPPDGIRVRRAIGTEFAAPLLADSYVVCRPDLVDEAQLVGPVSAHRPSSRQVPHRNLARQLPW